jgi:hypothetical protein
MPKRIYAGCCRSFSPDIIVAGVWGVMALLSLIFCAYLSFRWEEKLYLAPNGVLLRGDTFGDSRPQVQKRPRAAPTGQTFQRIENRSGQVRAEYGFVNFNNDPLQVSFAISTKELAAYRSGYGYTDTELEALKQWQKKALDDAYQTAVKNRYKQEQLNKMGDSVKAEYRAKFKALLTSRGFALLPGNVLSADIPAIIRRNVKNLRPVAITINSAADKRKYDADDIISAALALVQTAILYENVPMEIGGRQTGGIYPPLDTMARGKGDCDTKTALLGAILMNWDKLKMVGVGVPNHYLMAVLRNPAKGDAYVEYKGLRYILIEPAGPAWLPPGAVGPATTELLRGGKGLSIEPITAN